MKHLLPLILFALAAPAQDVDLSGPWKWRAADDLRFAGPNWDDSGWEIRSLPRRTRVPLGYSWYRKTATAPQQTSGLAIAIAAVSHCVEVFVNGQPVGGSGCTQDADPPFFAPRSYSIPDALLTPGQPFVVALRTEGRATIWATTSAGLVPDEGPYLVAGSARAAEAAQLHMLRMQRRISAPMSLLGWNSLGGSLILIALWIRNRDRLELLWFGLFQMAVTGINYSQLWMVHLGSYLHLFSWIMPVGYIFLGLGSYRILHRRNLTSRGSAAVAALMLASRAFLPGFLVQVPGVLLPAWWALRVYRAASFTERLFGCAILAYAAAALNSAGNRMFPVQWPVPGSFVVPGDFVMAPVAVVNGVLSSLVVVLLIIRLGEDWREKQRLAAELDAARTMQQLLVPTRQSGCDWTQDVVYQPAREVGGDFCQIRLDPSGSLLVLVGDVSGKGLEAAMFASVAVGAFRAAITESPAAILEAMNRALCGHDRKGFATCCCARFDPSGDCTIANAGHPTPYADGAELVIEPGLPLGVTSSAAYTETVVTRASAFCFVSDGVVEAANSAAELFGFDRTREISTRSANEIAQAARAWGQNDDITVVTVQRTSVA